MFTVIWLDAILDKLADLYVAAGPDERQRMADGVDALNRRLAARPLDEGESRDGSLRITFTGLLAVRFRVNQADRTVRVVGVSRFGH